MFRSSPERARVFSSWSDDHSNLHHKLSSETGRVSIRLKETWVRVLADGGWCFYPVLITRYFTRIGAAWGRMVADSAGSRPVDQRMEAA